MARLTLGQKAERVLRMLLGFGNARIASAMTAYGFTQADLDEGWTLLRATSTVRASKQVDLNASPTVVANVDAWENQWYPIIDATLRRRYPDLHTQVFNNLSQTEGPSVLVGVTILLDRIAELEKAGDKDSKEARALLKDRGVTKAVIEEARGYLLEATIPAEVTVTPAEEVNAAIEEAETALWDWYLEWGQIARVAIKDGRQLAQLGFGAASRRRGAKEEAEEEVPVPAPAGPVGGGTSPTD